MRQIAFSQLRKEETAFSHLAAIDLVPVNRVYRQPPGGRPHSALMLIEEGECVFEWPESRVRLGPGGLVYLPNGSTHLYRTLSDSIRYIRIDFTLRDEAGETLIWSEHPLLMAEELEEENRLLCRQLCEAFLVDSLRMRLIMYTLLCRLSARAFPGELFTRLAPAMKRLEGMRAQETPTRELAALCGLSPTHFRRLFHRLTGRSPTAYRNLLRIQYACRLLENPDCRISEAAEQLGFDSLYYFSRVFRAEMGKSPSEWRRDRQ